MLTMDKSEKDSLPEVVLTKHSRFSIVWLVPIIAVAVAGWLAYDSYAKRGPTIDITFQDGSGLVAGKTEIQYLGVRVGLVDKVHLDEKLSQVVVKARLDKSASGLAVSDTAFWVVRPEIGAAGIRGLDTLLSGPYIGVSPGRKGDKATSFTGLPEQPPAGPNDPGLNLILQADKMGSLNIGDPVYYREFKVGAVDQVYLASDARSVHTHIHIKAEYAPLVRQNTKFWNASGIGMDIGLFGAKVKTESLAAILSGGVAFATPNNDEMGPAVSNGAVFELFDDMDDDWDKWSPVIELTNSDMSVAERAVGSSSNQTTVSQPDGATPIQPSPAPTVAPKGPPGRHE